MADRPPTGRAAEAGALHGMQQFLAAAQNVGIRKEAIVRRNGCAHVMHEQDELCVLRQAPSYRIHNPQQKDQSKRYLFARTACALDAALLHNA